MPGEVRVPVRLEVIQSSINTVKAAMDSLKPNSSGWRELQKILQSMQKEANNLQITMSKPFSTQSQFTQAEKGINKLENALDQARLTMSRIDFSDLKLDTNQQAVFDGFKRQLQDIQNEAKTFKASLKQSLQMSDAWEGIQKLDPNTATHSFDEIVKAVQNKVKSLQKNMQDAQKAFDNFQPKLKSAKFAEQFASNKDNSFRAAMGEDFNKFFVNGNQLKFKSGQQNPFYQFIQENLQLDSSQIEAIKQAKRRDLEQIFKDIDMSKILSQARGTISEGQNKQTNLNNANVAYEEAQRTSMALGQSLDQLRTKEDELQQKTNQVNSGLQQFQVSTTEAARGSTNFSNGVTQANQGLERMRTELKQSNAEMMRYQRTMSSINSLKMTVTNFMGFTQVLNIVKKGVREAIQHIHELDDVMNGISVVTNMSTGDLWDQIDAYSSMASKYGVSIKGAYEVSRIYYQQGLETADVMTLTNETLKLAKISGLDYATTTDYMTTALRGFKMEMSDAGRVVDVYSNLAAHTAVSSEELAVAMSKTASSMESVGSTFEESSAMIATMVAVTRESATNIGSALKSIAARYGEMKSDPLKLVDAEGDVLSYNKVDAALQSVGISLKDSQGEFRNFTDVILELSEVWDQLDSTQQRYIATQFAGNRQQSRFLALVSNKDLLKANLGYAEDSEGVGDTQSEKTLDSISSKLEQAKVAYQEFYTSIGLENIFKGALDGIKEYINYLNRLPKAFGNIPVAAIGMVMNLINAFKLVGTALISGLGRIFDKIIPTEKIVNGIADAYKEGAEQGMNAMSQTAQSRSSQVAQDINQTTQQTVTTAVESQTQQPSTRPFSQIDGAAVGANNFSELDQATETIRQKYAVMASAVISGNEEIKIALSNLGSEGATIAIGNILQDNGMAEQNARSIAQGIVNQLQLVPQETQQITSQVGTSAAEGVQQGANEASNAATALGTTILEALRAALNIHSPSPLIIELLRVGVGDAAVEALIKSGQEAGLAAGELGDQIISMLSQKISKGEISLDSLKNNLTSQLGSLSKSLASLSEKELQGILGPETFQAAKEFSYQEQQKHLVSKGHQAFDSAVKYRGNKELEEYYLGEFNKYKGQLDNLTVDNTRITDSSIRNLLGFDLQNFLGFQMSNREFGGFNNQIGLKIATNATNQRKAQEGDSWSDKTLREALRAEESRKEAERIDQEAKKRREETKKIPQEEPTRSPIVDKTPVVKEESPEEIRQRLMASSGYSVDYRQNLRNAGIDDSQLADNQLQLANLNLGRYRADVIDKFHIKDDNTADKIIADMLKNGTPELTQQLLSDDLRKSKILPTEENYKRVIDSQKISEPSSMDTSGTSTAAKTEIKAPVSLTPPTDENIIQVRNDIQSKLDNQPPKTKLELQFDKLAEGVRNSGQQLEKARQTATSAGMAYRNGVISGVEPDKLDSLKQAQDRANKDVYKAEKGYDRAQTKLSDFVENNPQYEQQAAAILRIKDASEEAKKSITDLNNAASSDTDTTSVSSKTDAIIREGEAAEQTRTAIEGKNTTESGGDTSRIEAGTAALQEQAQAANADAAAIRDKNDAENASNNNTQPGSNNGAPSSQPTITWDTVNDPYGGQYETEGPWGMPEVQPTPQTQPPVTIRAETDAGSVQQTGEQIRSTIQTSLDANPPKIKSLDMDAAINNTQKRIKALSDFKDSQYSAGKRLGKQLGFDKLTGGFTAKQQARTIQKRQEAEGAVRGTGVNADLSNVQSVNQELQRQKDLLAEIAQLKQAQANEAKLGEKAAALEALQNAQKNGGDVGRAQENAMQAGASQEEVANEEATARAISDTNNARWEAQEAIQQQSARLHELGVDEQNAGNSAIEAQRRAAEAHRQAAAAAAQSRRTAGGIVRGLSSAVSMATMFVDKTTEAGQKAAGAMTAASGIMNIGAGFMTGGWVGGIMSLATSIPMIVSGIQQLAHRETTAEKMEKVIKEAEEDAKESGQKASESKSNYKNLKQQIEAINELKEKRFESKEATEQYQEAVDNLADAYPELISGFDEMGRAIYDNVEASKALAEAQRKSAEDSYDAAQDALWAKMQKNYQTNLGTVNGIATDRFYTGTEHAVTSTLFKENAQKFNTSIYEVLDGGLEEFNSDTTKFFRNSFQTYGAELKNNNGSIETAYTDILNDNTAYKNYLQEMFNYNEKALETVDYQEDIEQIYTALSLMAEYNTTQNYETAIKLSKLKSQMSKSAHDMLNSMIFGISDDANANDELNAITFDSQLDKIFAVRKYEHEVNLEMESLVRQWADTINTSDTWGKSFGFLTKSSGLQKVLTKQYASDIRENTQFGKGIEDEYKWDVTGGKYLNDSLVDTSSLIYRLEDFYKHISTTNLELSTQINDALNNSDLYSFEDIQTMMKNADYSSSAWTAVQDDVENMLTGYATDVQYALIALQEEYTHDAEGNLVKNADKISNAITTMTAHTDTQLELNIISQTLEQYKVMADAGLESASESFLTQVSAFYKEIQKSSLDPKKRIDILSTLSRNGFGSITDIDKTLASISQNNELSEQDKASLTNALTEIRKTIQTNLSLAIDVSLSELQEQWPALNEKLSKAVSGIDFSEMDSIINQADSFGIELTEKDFEISGKQVKLNTEKYLETVQKALLPYKVMQQDYNEVIQSAQEALLSENLAQIDNLEGVLWSVGKSIKDATDESGNIKYDKARSLLAEGYQEVLSKQSMLNFQIQQAEANATNQLLKTGNYLSILNDQFKTNEQKFEHLLDLASGKADYTQAELKDSNVKDVVKGIQSSYSKIISDIISKGIENIDWSDYEYIDENLVKNKLQGAQSTEDYVTMLSAATGGTIQEINSQIVQAIQKDTEQLSESILSNLNFVDSNIFTTDLKGLEELANTFDLPIQVLLQYYDRAQDQALLSLDHLNQLIIEYTNNKDVDLTQIRNFQETVQEALDNSISAFTDAFQKGIKGTLDIKGQRQLQDFLDAHNINLDLQYTKTKSGYQLSTKSAEELYNQLKQIDELSSQIILDELNDSIKDSLANAKDLSGTLKEIAQIRAGTESDQFKFMENKIPSGQNNPINYFTNWKKAFETMQAATKNKNLIDYTDFYNIITEMGNLASATNPIKLGGEQILTNCQDAANLIEQAAGALVVAADGSMKVDLSSIGIDFAASAEGMKTSVNAGIKDVAESQVEMLDGMIQVLETVVAMQELKDVVGEDNKLDISDIFPKIVFDENGAWTGELRTPAWTKYETFASNLHEKMFAIGKDGELLNEDLNKAGQTLKIGTKTLAEILVMTPEELADQGEDFLNGYTAMLNALYQAAESGNYDLDNIIASVKEILAGSNFNGQIDIGNNTQLVFKNGISYEIVYDEDKKETKYVFNNHAFKDEAKAEQAAQVGFLSSLGTKVIYGEDEIPTYMTISGEVQVTYNVNATDDAKFVATLNGNEIAKSNSREGLDAAIRAYAITHEADFSTKGAGGTNLDTNDVLSYSINVDGNVWVDYTLDAHLNKVTVDQKDLENITLTDAEINAINDEIATKMSAKITDPELIQQAQKKAQEQALAEKRARYSSGVQQEQIEKESGQGNNDANGGNEPPSEPTVLNAEKGENYDLFTTTKEIVDSINAGATAVITASDHLNDNQIISNIDNTLNELQAQGNIQIEATDEKFKKKIILDNSLVTYLNTQTGQITIPDPENPLGETLQANITSAQELQKILNDLRMNNIPNVSYTPPSSAMSSSDYSGMYSSKAPISTPTPNDKKVDNKGTVNETDKQSPKFITLTPQTAVRLEGMGYGEEGDLKAQIKFPEDEQYGEWSGQTYVFHEGNKARLYNITGNEGNVVAWPQNEIQFNSEEAGQLSQFITDVLLNKGVDSSQFIDGTPVEAFRKLSEYIENYGQFTYTSPTAEKENETNTEAIAALEVVKTALEESAKAALEETKKKQINESKQDQSEEQRAQTDEKQSPQDVVAQATEDIVGQYFAAKNMERYHGGKVQTVFKQNGQDTYEHYQGFSQKSIDRELSLSEQESVYSNAKAEILKTIIDNLTNDISNADTSKSVDHIIDNYLKLYDDILTPEYLEENVDTARIKNEKEREQELTQQADEIRRWMSSQEFQEGLFNSQNNQDRLIQAAKDNWMNSPKFQEDVFNSQNNQDRLIQAAKKASADNLNASITYTQDELDQINVLFNQIHELQEVMELQDEKDAYGSLEEKDELRLQELKNLYQFSMDSQANGEAHSQQDKLISELEGLIHNTEYENALYDHWEQFDLESFNFQNILESLGLETIITSAEKANNTIAEGAEQSSKETTNAAEAQNDAADNTNNAANEMNNSATTLDNAGTNLKEAAEAISNIQPTFGTTGIITGMLSGIRTKQTKVKGNTAFAAGTLMGELGPELVVSNGHYFVAGQNGAEFVDLDPDAIVFNHLQTASLLKNGMSKTRGKAVTNERVATSFAKGNVNGGPAQASASQALAALKQLRSQWQAIAKLDPSQMAGTGGGGGGGDPKAFLKDLEKWYNWLQQIAQLEKEITYEETKRSKIQSDMIAHGQDYHKSQMETLKYLQQQLVVHQSLTDSQYEYFEKRRKELNEQSAFSALYGFGESGQLYYKEGALSWLSDLSGRNATTGEANYTAEEQYKRLVDAGFEFAMKYDSSGNEIKQEGEDWYSTALQAFWDKMDSDKEEMQSLHDSVEEHRNAVLESQSSINEIIRDIEDNQINVEQKVLKAIEDSRQREIDEFQKERDAIEKSSKALIDGLSEQLNLEKEMYSNQQEADEFGKLQRQLAILQRSGGSASQITDLQRQISEKQQNMYFDAQQQQIDALQKASDNQLERLDHQIELMTEQLEYEKENGLLWNAVYEVLQGSPESISEFIKENTKEYWGQSPTELTKTIREDLFEIQRFKEFQETMDGGLDILTTLYGDEVAKKKAEKEKKETEEKVKAEGNFAASTAGGNGGGNSSGTSNKDQSNSQQKKANHGYEVVIDGKKYTNNGYSTQLEAANAMQAIISSFRITPTKVKVYHTGGLVDETGPAILQKHEGVLTASQVSTLRNDILSNKPTSLLSLLTDFRDAYNNISNATNSVIGPSDGGIIIENATVEMNVSQIANDYDAQRAGEQALDRMVQIARKSQGWNRIGGVK